MRTPCRCPNEMRPRVSGLTKRPVPQARTCGAVGDGNTNRHEARCTVHHPPGTRQRVRLQGVNSTRYIVSTFALWTPSLDTTTNHLSARFTSHRTPLGSQPILAYLQSSIDPICTTFRRRFNRPSPALRNPSISSNVTRACLPFGSHTNARALPRIDILSQSPLSSRSMGPSSVDLLSNPMT